MDQRQDVPSTSDEVVTPPPQQWELPMPRRPNQPCEDLFYGSRRQYIRIGVPLYEASINGDWEFVKAILDKRPELVRWAITENYETALHVAASVEDNKLMEHFVQKLVDKMDKKDLELLTKNDNTALSLAAAAGSVKLARIMVKKNSALPEISGSNGMMPLYVAALFRKHKMVKYLYNISKKMTGKCWTYQNRVLVFQKCVEADMFDVAIQIMIDHPELTAKWMIIQDVPQYVLQVLARKPDAFNRREGNIVSRITNSIVQVIRKKLGPAKKDNNALQLLRIIWKKIEIMPKKYIDDILIGPASAANHDPPRILFIAAKMGNTRFIVELLRSYPDLIWKKNGDGLSIIHVAVKHRHEEIYNLLYEMGSMKDFITPLTDKEGNNMLHLVGKSSKIGRGQAIWGLPKQMHREVLWFKEVQRMMPLDHRERKNKSGETPYEVFSENNTELVSQGMKWINDCMVVATLIVTVAFAVAFTVPGGYNQNNGVPMFIQKSSFIAFVVADAISLVSSSAALLVFLSIRISHRQRGFLVSLPRKLLIGIATLLISVTAMLTTFSISFFVLYHNNLKWVPILIGVFASMPLILYVILQHTLLVDMVRAMYDSRYLFKPKKRSLYKRNRRS